ncbi:MAG: hypothetical protein HZC36_01385 [Armatimonadetes bacterium]|nr:hypothetical protein [Armatimonadota bacterium]
MPCVVFDIGGVLVRIRQTWGECAEAVGVDLPQDVAKLKNGAFGLLDPYQEGLVETSNYVTELQAFLGGASAEDAIAVHNGMLAEAYAGTAQLASELSAAGVTCGCLSNTNELHWPVLHGSGTYPAISGLALPLASHQVRLAKPNPEIYRRFEAMRGLAPVDHYYFEDHPDYIAAAASCGWNACIIDPNDDTAAQMRSYLAMRGVL